MHRVFTSSHNGPLCLFSNFSLGLINCRRLVKQVYKRIHILTLLTYINFFNWIFSLTMFYLLHVHVSTFVRYLYLDKIISRFDVTYIRIDFFFQLYEQYFPTLLRVRQHYLKLFCTCRKKNIVFITFDCLIITLK